jgi:hypothetical protein
MKETKHQVEMWPVESLAPYERNPRKNDHAVAKMAEFIDRFGFRIPVLARSNGEIVDGHLRYKAALYLGMEEVPVQRCDDMSEAEIRAFRIAVNKAAELADWDLDLLEVEFEAINAEGFSIEFAGFDTNEIDTLFPESSPFMHTPPPAASSESRAADGKMRDTDPPEEFTSYDEDIETDYCCPKCGFSWSGKAK